VLDGFTLTGASPGSNELSAFGGGIYIKATNPTLKNLIIENNSSFYPMEQGVGGGIYCESGSIKASNLKIRKNICGGTYGGGGIYAANSNIILDNCEISKNCTWGASFRGGLYFSNINFLIENSKIEYNDQPDWLPPNPTAIGIDNSVGSFVNTIINDSIRFMNSNIKFNKCIINGVIYP
jgi:hypothetical protein